MVKAGDVLDLGPLGAIFHVTKTAEDTGGASFEMEWELAPHSGGTPVHVHPHAVETYEVTEGHLDLYVDGAWRTLGVGESLSVPKGAPHTFRNAGDAPARVRNAHLPAMRFEEYFVGLAKLVENGAIKSDKPDLKALLHLAVLMTEHPDEIRTVKPPHFVIRAMGAVGRGLGYGVEEKAP